MPRPWKRPTLPPGSLGELNRALHELHHRAGWPSSRQIRVALDDKGVPMSHTKIHDTLTKPALPTKGAVEMITEVLAGVTRGVDVNIEVDRLLDLWDKASLDNQTSTAAASESSTVEPSPTEKQVATGQGWREKAESGDTDAMHNLGGLLRKRGEHEEAVDWYQRAAKAGHIEAMVQLGDLLEKQQKYKEALDWYRIAAKAGHPDGMYYLGSLLPDFGEDEEADYWVRRAADSGQGEALAYLGSQLERGGKHLEALIWYRRAAQVGDTGGMRNLGCLLLERGERVEAETWLRRAAQAGDIDAMRDLSRVLRSRGDHTEADMWDRRERG